jgi:hypothetical protein
MKIYIENVTGSQKTEAVLDKNSGVVTFPCGEVSHILFEKQSGKKIQAYKEGVHGEVIKKEESVKEEVKKEEPEVKPSSTEQSKARPEKKSKTK